MQRPRLTHPTLWAAAAAGFAAGCEGPFSTLTPAGRDAERIVDLFWWMVGGAVVIWVAVMAMAIYAVLTRAKHSRTRTRYLIIGGGAVFPTVVLTILLLFGLGMMPDLMDRGVETGGPRAHVSAEQWWWRVTYEMPDGARFELANELYLPVDHRLPIRLESPDVVHSLWVPALGGKTDAIPGRVNHMALEPTRTGVFRGVCAEYCGESHARMLLHAVVTDRADFDEWARAQQRPAVPPADATAARGQELFLALGCGACHTVRCTHADGVIGPDLTHVGSRQGLGAGVLDNDVEGFERFLTHTEQVKPGVHMPSFGMLPEDERHALATYLDGLR